MDYIIQIKDFSYKYDEYELFKNISLNIKRGSITTIMGNGNIGRTTLSKILCGKISIKADIKIDGKSINKISNRELRKSVIVVSENNDNIFVCNTVSEQIYFYLKTKGISKDIIDNKIKDFICNLGFEYILNESPNKLSSGEKQILSLFLAVSSNPKILIIDDGLSMIDNNTKDKIFIILKSMNKRGLTIINFTHDSEEILKGTNIVLLDKGNVILNEKVESAFNNVDIFIRNKIKLPFIIELSEKLKYYKVTNKTYYNLKKLVNDIWE